jgi:hypothetical protein
VPLNKKRALLYLLIIAGYFALVGFITDRAAEYFSAMSEFVRMTIVIALLIPAIVLAAKAYALWNNEPD